MKLAFRVDGAPVIGGGHVMRSLTLAEAARARGWQARFICRDHEGALIAKIESAGFAVTVLQRGALMPKGADYETWLGAPEAVDAKQTMASLGPAPDWLIVDHYGVGNPWLSAVPLGVKTLVMDDLARVDLRADLLLDQTRLDKIDYPASKVLHGPQYALLRAPFQADAPQRHALKRLLITPGMGDAYGLGPLALEAALAVPLPLDIDVVVGPLMSRDTLLEQAKNPRVTLHEHVSDMAPLILAADLAIGAAGMSSWERCALGLGTIVVPVADNQIRLAAELETAGAGIRLGAEHRPTPAQLTEAINSADIAALSRGASQLCDGRGAARVLDAIGL